MDSKIAARYSARSLRLLGQGGESRVYELDDQRVLRVLKGGGDHTASLGQLQELYDLAAPVVSFALPRLLEVGISSGETYSIEERIPGRVMSEVLPAVTGADREQILSNYLSAAEQFQSVAMPHRPYGELLTGDPLTTTPGTDSCASSSTTPSRRTARLYNSTSISTTAAGHGCWKKWPTFRNTRRRLWSTAISGPPT